MPLTGLVLGLMGACSAPPEAPEDFDAACLQERRLQAQFYVAAGLFTSADCNRSVAPKPTVEELAEAGVDSAEASPLPHGAGCDLCGPRPRRCGS